MLKSIKIFLITLFFLSFSYSQSNKIYGSFESNAVYYQENEEEDYENKLASNNYLNIKYLFNSNWNVEVQVESYLPKRIQGFSNSFEKTHLSTLSINYSKNDFNTSIGTIYDQFGSGLILRTWEDRQLGINNSLWGFRTSFDSKNFNIKLLGGWQKKGIEISSGKVVGIDSNIKLLNNDNKYQNMVLGLSYVGRFENLNYIEYDFNDLTNLFSTRLDYYTNEFYLEYEQVIKSKDGIIQAGLISNEFVKKGSAHSLNLGFIQTGFGLDMTFRRLENMPVFSDRFEQGEIYNESNVNYLPALTKQHDYQLANINVYESQPNVSFPDPGLMKAGEIGYQFDLYYNLKEGSSFGGKYGSKLSLNISSWYNLKGKYNYFPSEYDTDFIGFGEKYFSEQSLEIRKKWSEKFDNIFLFINKYYNKRFVEEKSGEINSRILVIDNTLKLNNKKSIRLEIQHLNTKDDKKNWYGYGLEYNFNYNISAYYNTIVNYENLDEDKPTFYSIGASYNKNASRFSVSYGKERGGLLCFGGICRYIPEFKGFSFTVNTSF
tara:strand:- start:401 stop:2038 length:1638 start_codon:yes stop_codon:yes gene_type:complete